MSKGYNVKLSFDSDVRLLRVRSGSLRSGLDSLLSGLVGVNIPRAGEDSRMLEDARRWLGTNEVLAVVQTEARFFCKDGWKEIDPDI